ncbi:hypothetical protein [Paraburkholderia sp. J41]|uniref:hypothetical protein n=1 Tax=Paraburkholderia sp. J41 TaxID=2805433 RepID=UPI002AC32615|nr:hypothetical protein [Paraburkholderia sp. J41]
MESYSLVVCAGIGQLQTVPIWREVLQSGATVRAWRVHVDEARVEESLTIELVGLTSANFEAFVARLNEVPEETRQPVSPVSAVDRGATMRTVLAPVRR